MKRLARLELNYAFDPEDPSSRPTPAQQAVFDDIETVRHRYIIAGNQSGKSALAAREIAWIVSDTHPTWTRPERWGDAPLFVIVAGQDRRMMEHELWTKKIKPFLDPADWQERRVGGQLQHVEHRHFGHKIVFVSHNDSSEKNRKHMQGYVAHYVWLDEMPSDIRILEELQRRVDARDGYLLATFTPKARNEEIRRVIDSAVPPLAKRYRLSKLENPLYADRLDQEITKLAGYSEEYKNTILYGDWYSGDSAVFDFVYEKMVVDEIPYYSKAWRHVLSVDPALKSKCGFTLWAEDPTNGTWFLVRDDYLEDLANPDELISKIQALTQGYNVVKRISDPHESWFIGQSAKYRIIYELADKSSTRKGDLIKNLQLALSTGTVKVAAWCGNFITEVQACQWAEGGRDRIVNESRYHVLDAARYFVDMKPSYDETQRVMPWYVELRQKNDERKKRNAAEEAAKRSSPWRERHTIQQWSKIRASRHLGRRRRMA